MDRAYIDFVRLYRFTLAAAFFVLRSKTNIEIQRRYSHPVDKSTGVRADQTVILTSLESAKAYPNLDRHAMPGDTLAALNRLAPALVQFRKNFSGTPIPDWPNWKSPSGRPLNQKEAYNMVPGRDPENV